MSRERKRHDDHRSIEQADDWRLDVPEGAPARGLRLHLFLLLIHIVTIRRHRFLGRVAIGLLQIRLIRCCRLIMRLGQRLGQRLLLLLCAVHIESEFEHRQISALRCSQPDQPVAVRAVHLVQSVHEHAHQLGLVTIDARAVNSAIAADVAVAVAPLGQGEPRAPLVLIRVRLLRAFVAIAEPADAPHLVGRRDAEHARQTEEVAQAEHHVEDLAQQRRMLQCALSTSGVLLLHKADADGAANAMIKVFG